MDRNKLPEVIKKVGLSIADIAGAAMQRLRQKQTQQPAEQSPAPYEAETITPSTPQAPEEASAQPKKKQERIVLPGRDDVVEYVKKTFEKFYNLSRRAQNQKRRWFTSRQVRLAQSMFHWPHQRTRWNTEPTVDWSKFAGYVLAQYYAPKGEKIGSEVSRKVFPYLLRDVEWAVNSKLPYALNDNFDAESKMPNAETYRTIAHYIRFAAEKTGKPYEIEDVLKLGPAVARTWGYHTTLRENGVTALMYAFGTLLSKKLNDPDNRQLLKAIKTPKDQAKWSLYDAFQAANYDWQKLQPEAWKAIVAAEAKRRGMGRKSDPEAALAYEVKPDVNNAHKLLPGSVATDGNITDADRRIAQLLGQAPPWDKVAFNLANNLAMTYHPYRLDDDEVVDTVTKWVERFAPNDEYKRHFATQLYPEAVARYIGEAAYNREAPYSSEDVRNFIRKVAHKLSPDAPERFIDAVNQRYAFLLTAPADDVRTADKERYAWAIRPPQSDTEVSYFQDIGLQDADLDETIKPLVTRHFSGKSKPKAAADEAKAPKVQAETPMEETPMGEPERAKEDRGFIEIDLEWPPGEPESVAEETGAMAQEPDDSTRQSPTPGAPPAEDLQASMPALHNQPQTTTPQPATTPAANEPPAHLRGGIEQIQKDLKTNRSVEAESKIIARGLAQIISPTKLDTNDVLQTIANILPHVRTPDNEHYLESLIPDIIARYIGEAASRAGPNHQYSRDEILRFIRQAAEKFATNDPASFINDVNASYSLLLTAPEANVPEADKLLAARAIRPPRSDTDVSYFHDIGIKDVMDQLPDQIKNVIQQHFAPAQAIQNPPPGPPPANPPPPTQNVPPPGPPPANPPTSNMNMNPPEQNKNPQPTQNPPPGNPPANQNQTQPTGNPPQQTVVQSPIPQGPEGPQAPAQVPKSGPQWLHLGLGLLAGMALGAILRPQKQEQDSSQDLQKMLWMLMMMR